MCSPAARPVAATSRSPSATCPPSGAGSGCRTWKSLAAASAPRRSAGASWWSAARSSPGTIREVEGYDPARRSWTRLPDLRTPRHGLGVVSYRGRVYAIEGGLEPGFFFSRANEALDVR